MYEKFFVPALFSEWAPRVLAAAQVQPGERILDVACGTGVLARAAAAAVGPTGTVTGVDRNSGMLAVARRMAPMLEWVEGDAQKLGFADEVFDAVVSQFGLMFFEDRATALHEMWRVVRRGGRIAVAVWGSLEEAPAYATMVNLFDRLAGPAAADALRAPFVLGSVDELRSQFDAAEIPNVTIASQMGVARFSSIRSMVELELRGWLPIAGVFLSEEVIARVLQESEMALRDHVIADGTVQFAISARIATARRSG